jgi:hypothetical protein
MYRTPQFTDIVVGLHPNKEGMFELISLDQTKELDCFEHSVCRSGWISRKGSRNLGNGADETGRNGPVTGSHGLADIHHVHVTAMYGQPVVSHAFDRWRRVGIGRCIVFEHQPTGLHQRVLIAHRLWASPISRALSLFLHLSSATTISCFVCHRSG